MNRMCENLKVLVEEGLPLFDEVFSKVAEYTFFREFRELDSFFEEGIVEFEKVAEACPELPRHRTILE